MELKGSKTEKNLQDAFAGESQARNKYTYFASVARKEGYEQISALFLETAGNEMEHAKLWFKALGELVDQIETGLVISERAAAGPAIPIAHALVVVRAAIESKSHAFDIKLVAGILPL